MPAHFPVLKEQLKADIRTVIGGASEVHFGRPRRLMPYPHAVVLTLVKRRNGIRDVTELWEFQIAVKLPLPVPYPEDGADIPAMESATELADLLAPFDTASVPSPAGPYAGVGGKRYVTSIVPIVADDTDAYIGYVLTFTCETTVYQ
jgi:hypothetical protein